jgi:hypothetical protein
VTQAEVLGRLAEVEFSVVTADGATSLLPVVVRGADVYSGASVVQSFAARRGQVEHTGPGRYGVRLNPALHAPQTWFNIRWFIYHPVQHTDGFLDVEYFFHKADPSPSAPDTVFPDKTISEVGGVDEYRHLIGLAIQKRETLLLRRFNGSFVALFLRKDHGKRCPECFDERLGRRTKSECYQCDGTGFKVGYSKPIYGWVYHPNPPFVSTLTQLGEMKEQKGSEQGWTTAYPLLRPGDFYVMRDNSRWRILAPVQNTKLEGHTGPHAVRQIYPVQRIDPDDVVMQMPVPDLARPLDTFVGFMKGDTKTDLTGVTFRASGLL